MHCKIGLIYSFMFVWDSNKYLAFILGQINISCSQRLHMIYYGLQPQFYQTSLLKTALKCYFIVKGM